MVKIKWTEEEEKKIIKLLTDEYTLANIMISHASHKPLNEGLEIINVEKSVDSVVKQIKQILDV